MKRWYYRWLPTAVATALAVGLAAGCTVPRRHSAMEPPPVTEAQARALLAGLVTAALEEDWVGLCAQASTPSMCLRLLESRYAARAPKAPPKLQYIYELPPQKAGNSRTVGGQVLAVKGVDGTGQPFRTEVLVFHDGEQPRATNAIWWSNMGVAPSRPIATVEGSATAAGETRGKEGDDRDPCPSRWPPRARQPARGRTPGRGMGG